MYLNILDPFESWKRFTAHQEHSHKFLQKKGGKNIPFLDGNIPCLEGRRGGGSKGLNEKNRPQVIFKFLGPPCPQRPTDLEIDGFIASRKEQRAGNGDGRCEALGGRRTQ